MIVALSPDKSLIVDAARRRHLSRGMDFDFRSSWLSAKIADHWDEVVKQQHENSKASIRQQLIEEFGNRAIDAKMENFIAVDTKPISVLSYHNALFHHIRQSYVIGAYYPALVGACTLGERILNHLVIDLRDYYKETETYKRVRNKKSFDNWQVTIDALESWKVLLPMVVTEFRALLSLRNRSIHFNPDTYATLKKDALAAILHMRTIIEQQFGSFGLRPWFIEGTSGQIFIKKDYEENPFVKTYFLPVCPFVGPLFSLSMGDQGWMVHDKDDYGMGSWSDEEFAKQYNQRDPKDIAQGVK